MHTRHIRMMLWSIALTLTAASMAVVATAVWWPPTAEPIALDLSASQAGATAYPDAHQPLPTIDAFAQVWNLDLQQPVFKPPPEPKPPQEAAQSAPLPFRLMGTVIEPGHTLALFAGQDERVEFKAVGEQMGDSHVCQITARSVTLTRGRDTLQMDLPRENDAP